MENTRTLHLKIGESTDQYIDTIERWMSEGYVILVIDEDETGNEISRITINGRRYYSGELRIFDSRSNDAVTK